MTTAELAQNDGRDGRPAYLAVNGVIYDVSDSSRWQNGTHEGVHQAGQDLTEALKSAPHVRTVIERFPVVGQITEAAAESSGKGRTVALAIIAVIAILVLVAIFI